MKTRVLSCVLALILCLGLAPSVFAVSDEDAVDTSPASTVDIFVDEMEDEGSSSEIAMNEDESSSV